MRACRYLSITDMWAQKEGELEIGKGLMHLAFWMMFQAFIICLLESAHLLPGDLLGIDFEYNLDSSHSHFTLSCGIIGFIYTTVGCFILRRHEVNSRGWWTRMVIWYVVYLPLAFLAFYYELGWRVIDVWFCPILWVGEIELIYHLQKKVSERYQGTRLFKLFSDDFED